MKKSELREIIKPMVKECLQESMQQILLESGLLSAVISEVVSGLNATPIVEQKKEVKRQVAPQDKEINNKKMNETRKRMLEVIGKDSYGGVNVFEGTKPTLSDSSPNVGALKDTDPDDPGVDISTIFNSNWNKLI